MIYNMVLFTKNIEVIIMRDKDYHLLMQLVDDLEHEECSKHEDCEDETNPCIFYRKGMCIIFYFSALLDELKT